MTIIATIKISNIDPAAALSLDLAQFVTPWQGQVNSLPLTDEGFAAIDRTIRAVIAEFGGYTASVTVQDAEADYNSVNAEWTPESGLDITAPWVAHRFALNNKWAAIEAAKS